MDTRSECLIAPSIPPSELMAKMSQRLGKYEILEEIGHDDFAVVYKAHDTEIDRIAVLKVLPRPHAGGIHGSSGQRGLLPRRDNAGLGGGGQHGAVVGGVGD